jgi:hypothetical protein
MVTVWLASAATAVSPTPSTGAVYRQPYSSPDGAIVPATITMVTCLPCGPSPLCRMCKAPGRGQPVDDTAPTWSRKSGRRTIMPRLRMSCTTQSCDRSYARVFVLSTFSGQYLYTSATAPDGGQCTCFSCQGSLKLECWVLAADKRYILRPKTPPTKTSRGDCSNLEIHCDHLVFLNSAGELTFLCMLDRVESWTEM